MSPFQASTDAPLARRATIPAGESSPHRSPVRGGRARSALIAAIASAMVALVGLGAWRADASVVEPTSSFVSIDPCRIIDTRPAPDRVGAVDRLEAGETATVQVLRDDSPCPIPLHAEGLIANVTAIGASAPTFLTIWPGGNRPLASSLNPTPGAPPTPNEISIRLSTSGSFDVYNAFGAVDVVIDVTGYFTGADTITLWENVERLDRQVAELVSAQPIVTTSQFVDHVTVRAPGAVVAALEVTAPADGLVSVIGVATGFEASAGGRIDCEVRAQQHDTRGSVVSWTAPVANAMGSLTSIGTFAVRAESTDRFELWCTGTNVGDQTTIRSPMLRTVFSATDLEAPR